MDGAGDTETRCRAALGRVSGPPPDLGLDGLKKKKSAGGFEMVAVVCLHQGLRRARHGNDSTAHGILREVVESAPCLLKIAAWNRPLLSGSPPPPPPGRRVVRRQKKSPILSKFQFPTEKKIFLCGGMVGGLAGVRQGPNAPPPPPARYACTPVTAGSNPAAVKGRNRPGWLIPGDCGSQSGSKPRDTVVGNSTGMD